MFDKIYNADRLRGFSDGMFGVIITIMVLDLKPPKSAEPAALLEDWPTFVAYALSFLQAAIYWVNHVALFKNAEKIDDGVLWLNLSLLFSLSLMPFATAYVGDQFPAHFPVALYAFVMLLPGLAWQPMHKRLAALNPGDEGVSTGALVKGWIALALYGAAIAAAFVNPYVSVALIAAVAVMFFAPAKYS